MKIRYSLLITMLLSVITISYAETYTNSNDTIAEDLTIVNSGFEDTIAVVGIEGLEIDLNLKFHFTDSTRFEDYAYVWIDICDTTYGESYFNKEYYAEDLSEPFFTEKICVPAYCVILVNTEFSRYSAEFKLTYKEYTPTSSPLGTYSDTPWLYEASSNNFYFSIDTDFGIIDKENPVMSLNKNGKLGVGTSPVNQLDIASKSQFSINTDDASYVKFGNLETTGKAASVESQGNVQVVIDNDNNSNSNTFSVKKNSTASIAPLLTVKENGDVGIGVADPKNKLEVKGGTTFSVNTNDSKYLKFGNFRSSFDILSMESRSSAQIVIDSDSDNGSTNKAYFDVKNDGTENPPILRVHQSGRVGIGGVEDPDATLHVDGDSYVTGNIGIGGQADNAKLHVYGQSKLVGNSYLTGGKVGIGTTSPDAKLHVNGITKLEGDVYNTGVLRTTEVIIEVEGPHWPDYVFESDYNLLDLMEVEAHIAEKGHLPSIPSAAQVAEEGVSLGEMNKLLLQKVEELTLYMIELKKQNDQLANEVEALKVNR